MAKVKSATRFRTVTVEIPQAASGLAAKAYAHVDYDPQGHAVAVRLCEKGKDGSSLDQILTAVGDAITSALEVIDAKHRRIEGSR